MDIKTLQLLCRFALQPNKEKLCGDESSQDMLIRCITAGSCADLETEFTKFKSLYPNLLTITGIAGIPNPYHPDVVSTYLFGSDILKRVKPKHYSLFLKHLASAGIPKVFIEELEMHRPVIFLPFHLAHILHMSIVQTGGKLPDDDYVSNCMVGWGKIQEISGNQANTALNSIRKEEKGYQLTTIMRELSLSETSPEVRSGDIVAVHRQQIIKTLAPEEQKNIAHWTNRVINAYSGT